MKLAVRAALALSLLLGVYVLAAGILIGLGLVLHQAVQHGLTGVLVGKGLGLLLLLAVVMGRAVWSARGAGREEPTGLPLAPEDQPQLWGEVRAIAETVGTRPPDAIVLVPDVNASVWEGSRLLGLVAGRRVMTLGAPLVQGLTRQQLRAVLAHELGHYSHGHTSTAPVVYRGHVTLAHLVTSIGRDTWTGRVFAAYGGLYLRLARAVTRRQEVEADGWSHRVAGRAAAAGALREVPALDALWEHFLDELAFPLRGVRPDELFAGYANLLASPQRQREMQRIRDAVPEQQVDPYDTHPSLRSRIDYFEALPDDGIPDDRTPATTLLEDLDGLFRRFEADLFGEAGLEPMPWVWIAEHAGVERVRRNAAMLVRAAPDAGARTLEEALRALALHDYRRLARPLLAPDSPPDQAEAVARSLVGDAISAGLVEHCGARFVVDRYSSVILVDAAGEPVDVAGLVAAATAGESADWLVRALEDEGVPASFAVDPAVFDAQHPRVREPVVHSLASYSFGAWMRVVVVADSGLIVKRLGIVEGFAATLRQASPDPYLMVVRHVAAIPLPQLLEDRRAALFPWDEVGPSRLKGRRLVLRLPGRRRRTRIRTRAVAGDLAGSLQHHLGERLTLA